jgi:carbonic anhydrase
MRESLLFLALTITSCSAQTFWNEGFRLDYDYDLNSPQGPSNWDSVAQGIDNSEWYWYDSVHPIFDLSIDGNECGDTDLPSPLNLVQDSGCNDSAEIFTRQKAEGDCTQQDLTFVVTPQTLKAYFPLDDADCRRPTIVLDNYDDAFILVWMEMHARSEHVIDGRRFDAELQMLHMGTGNTDGTNRIATVSVLIDASARQDNSDFQFLLDGWQQVVNGKCTARRQLQREQLLRKSALTTEMKVINSEVGSKKEQRDRRAQTCQADRFGRGCEPLGPRKRMYPYNMWPSIHYYSYEGSITAPPCSKIVHWRILDEPMLISRRQYKQLAKLLQAYKNGNCESDTDVSPSGENFRPLQRKNDSTQRIRHCTFDDFGFELYNPEDQ